MPIFRYSIPFLLPAIKGKKLITKSTRNKTQWKRKEKKKKNSSKATKILKHKIF